jgi:transcriptional regulator with XRE-family HTH domain
MIEVRRTCMPTLREVRIRRLLSQRELAKRANVVQRTIVEAEAGRQVPHPRTMRKLAEALDVDPMEVDEFRAAIEGAVEAAAEKVAA